MGRTLRQGLYVRFASDSHNALGSWTPVSQMGNRGCLTPGHSAARGRAGGRTQASGAEVEKPCCAFSDFRWPVHARLAPDASVGDARRGRVRGSAPEGWAAVRRRRIGRDRVLAGNSTRRLPGLEMRPSQRPRMSDPVSVEGPGEARPWGRDAGQRRQGCRPAGGAGQAGRSEARSWEAGSFGLGPHGLSVFYPFVQLSEPSPG